MIDKSVSDLSLVGTGFFFRFQKKSRWLGGDAKGYRKRVFLQACITWLPLFILAMAQGVAWGSRTEFTFLKDFATHARFLLVLPLLILAEPMADNRLRLLTGQFFRSGILSMDEMPAFSEVKGKIRKIVDSHIPDLVIAVMVVVNIVLRWYGKPPELSTWWNKPGTDEFELSWAGGWYLMVSLPLLQYNLLHWIWRWVVWAIYYFRLSRLDLHLNPAHPDGAGGIAFLGVPMGPFFTVSLALSILFSGVFTERILFLHEKLASFYVPMAAFTVFIILLNVLPMLAFTMQLSKSRKSGLLKYGSLIQAHHRQFDEKWLGRLIHEDLLGLPEASSMTDLNSSYASVRAMGFVPFNLRTMKSGIFISIIPMVPLFAFEYNMLDILKKVLGMLF